MKLLKQKLLDGLSGILEGYKSGQVQHCMPFMGNKRGNKMWVKCNSHRAREKLFGLVGKDLKCYFSRDRACTGGFYEVDDSMALEALEITGVTRTKSEDLHPCIDWSVRSIK